MHIFKKQNAARAYIEKLKVQGKSVGFVPTMGALHEGHISLVHAALLNNNMCVVSIFVNPTQFNNKADLEKYPVTTSQDINMLAAAGCHVLYLPGIEEVYPGGKDVYPEYEIGPAEFLFEGAFRPGHFKGVVQVVDILLQTIQPNVLYLGIKDYQQCQILEKFCLEKFPDLKIEKVVTRREPSGLAMSSRNTRLSEADKSKASLLYTTLREIQEAPVDTDIPVFLVQKKKVLEDQGIKVEYLEVADTATLAISEPPTAGKEQIVLIAAWVGGVRLIDNLFIHPKSVF